MKIQTSSPSRLRSVKMKPSSSKSASPSNAKTTIIEDIDAGKATTPIDKGKAKANASPAIPSLKKNDRAQAPPNSTRSKTDRMSAANSEPPSGDEASSELSMSDDAALDSEDEAWRRDRYLQETLYGPPHASIEPEECFGPGDCQTLAAAESMYHRSKWLEMQANFYNATGRMIPLELIRAKCERVEWEQWLDSQPAMNGGVKVREWMSQLEGEEAPCP